MCDYWISNESYAEWFQKACNNWTIVDTRLCSLNLGTDINRQWKAEIGISGR